MLPHKCLIVLIINLSLFWPDLRGQTCCSGGVPLSANIGLPASDKGSWQFSLSYDRNLLKTLKNGDETLEDDLRERITRSLLFEVGYSIGTRWSVDMFLSVVEQQRSIFSGFGTSRTVTRGFGDMVLLLKYNVLAGRSASDWQLGIGPKLPTGSTDKRGEGGVSLPADLQPGSGSWDLVLWSNYAASLNQRPSMSFFITTSYRASGKNNDYLGSIVYEFGNELQVIAGLSDQQVLFSRVMVDPSLSFRYRRAARDRSNGVEIDATGGEWVFIVPGVTVTPASMWSLNMSMEWPLYSFVNNTQLTPTNRFTLGVFFKLSKTTTAL